MPRELLVFCFSVLSWCHRSENGFMVTPPFLHVPNSDGMSEGALPLRQSPLGSPVQVCLRGRTCG